MERVKADNRLDEVKAENMTGVADKASSLFNICLAVGNIIAPMLGGALVDGLGGVENGATGFNKAANVMSSVMLLNFIVYSIIQFVVLPNPGDKTGLAVG
jgi:hypothetical protein